MITKSQLRRIEIINKMLENLGSEYEIHFMSQKTPMMVTHIIKVKDNNGNDRDIKVASTVNTRKELNQFLTGMETALTCITEYAMAHKKENADNENPVSIRNENKTWDDVTGEGELTITYDNDKKTATELDISEMEPKDFIKNIFQPDTSDLSGIEPDEDEKI